MTEKKALKSSCLSTRNISHKKREKEKGRGKERGVAQNLTSKPGAITFYCGADIYVPFVEFISLYKKTTSSSVSPDRKIGLQGSDATSAAVY